MSNPGEKTENTSMEDKSNILCIKHEASKESFQEPKDDNSKTIKRTLLMDWVVDTRLIEDTGKQRNQKYI